MKISRKIQNITICSLFIVVLVTFILGSFNDQQISKAAIDDSNLFGILNTAFGMMPTILIGTYAGALLLFSSKLENKTLNILMRLFGGATVALELFFLFKESLTYTDFPRMQAHETLWRVLIVLFLAALVGLMFFLGYKNSKKIDKRLMIATSMIILIIIIGYAGSVEVVKYFVSRPRPRNVNSGLFEFRNWYEISPLKSLLDKSWHDCKSFVSGHAANSACMITVFPLALSMINTNKKEVVQIISTIIGFLFCALVCLSRIIAGAHYLTDTTGGVLLSMIVQIVVLNIGDFIIKKVK